jgi:hypothetical protein
MMSKITQKEFEGNILVTISEREVRLWVCNNEGRNIFRFKAIGNVYSQDNDVIIFGKASEALEALNDNP